MRLERGVGDLQGKGNTLIATRAHERVGRAPTQVLVELRTDEQAAIHRVASRAHQLAACRVELGRAADRKDRMAVYRFSDMQAALIEAIEAEAADALRMVRGNTPAFTGERPSLAVAA